jgi:RHS repeat-associated protein
VSVRRILLVATLVLLAIPAWAQEVAELPVPEQPGSAQSTTMVMQPSAIGDYPLHVTLAKPTAGQTFVIGSQMPLWADAEDIDNVIQSIYFKVDGAIVAITSSGSATWVVTSGSHSVGACATNDHVPMKTACTPTVQINTVPNKLPTVSLTSPSNGSDYLTGDAVSLKANADDVDIGVDRVEFFVDDVQYGSADTSSPYGKTWTATTGDHTIKARAVDGLGATKTSTSVSVHVNALPTINLTAPAPGGVYTVGSAVPLKATATDNDSIDRVEFFVDATELEDTASPYSKTWTATAGTHTVKARAVDNEGATRTTASISIRGNALPTATLLAPGDGSNYVDGDIVPIKVSASDDTGVDRVEFLIDGAEAGQVTGSPYTYYWSAKLGSHTVQARVFDDDGASKSTAAIDLGVAPRPTPPAALTRHYTYNSAQELCRVEEPETGATLMGYDAAGNLAWSASGLPTGTACDTEGDAAAVLDRKATRTYDARNRVTALNFADALADVTYAYTPTGQLAGMAAYNGGGTHIVTTSYTYNGRGMLEYERQFLAGSDWSHDWIIDYGYNANGHLSWQKVNAYGPAHTVAYVPNALGQPTQAGLYATGVAYFPNGAMKSFTYGNGIVHTLTQNLRGLPDRSRDTYGSTKFLDDGYDYDEVGNVAGISDGATGQSQRGDRTMNYDGLNRLTGVIAPKMFETASYGYDVLDNLTRVRVTAGSQARNVDYCYDPDANQLTNVKMADAAGWCEGATVSGLGYDVQGNLANKNGVLYSFDQGNRLRSVSSPASEYLYDGHGRRVWDATGGSRYSVYSQAGQLVFDYDKRSQRYRWYVYLNGSLVAIHDEDYETDATRTTYQHTDALGSPVATTSESRVVLQRSEYEPYGALLNRPLEDGPGYTGHETDAGTGLVYMQQRYYDPLCGCFLSTDPVTALDGPFNRYWYANNNPYRFTDPDGRESGAGYATGEYTMATPSTTWRDRGTAIVSVMCMCDATYVAPAGSGELQASSFPGEALIPAGGAARLGKAEEVVQRAMSKAELASTESTGLLRGGRDGTHYVSDAVNSGATRAQQRLALPVKPEVKATLKVPAGKFSPPSRVQPLQLPGGKTLPGGGMERTATGKIPVKILNVEDMQ